MEDIYNAIVSRNPEADCCLYFDDDGKPKFKTYEVFRDETFLLASKMSLALSGLVPNTVIGIKLKNSPRWPMVFGRF